MDISIHSSFRDTYAGALETTGDNDIDKSFLDEEEEYNNDVNDNKELVVPVSPKATACSVSKRASSSTKKPPVSKTKLLWTPTSQPCALFSTAKMNKDKPHKLESFLIQAFFEFSNLFFVKLSFMLTALKSRAMCWCQILWFFISQTSKTRKDSCTTVTNFFMLVT